MKPQSPLYRKKNHLMASKAGQQCHKRKRQVPKIICTIMNILYSTCIYNLLSTYRWAFNASNNKTEFCHGPVILSTSIKAHSPVLHKRKYENYVLIESKLMQKNEVGQTPIKRKEMGKYKV
jgi:hypothetical protein